MARTSGTSVGHRGHSEVTSDVRQAMHDPVRRFDEQPIQSSDHAFDLPQHLHSFRAPPDRPASAPALAEGIDEYENMSDPMPLHPCRAEQVRQIKVNERERREREQREREARHTSPSAFALHYSDAM